MGYSTTFRLKDKIVAQFQPNNYRVPNLAKSKSILTALCLYNYTIGDKAYDMWISFNKIYDNIDFALSELIKDAEQESKKKLFLNEKNEIDFYGWQYSDEDSHMGFDSLEEFKKCILDQLFQLVVCPTSTRFDKEHEDFNEKEEQVFDILGDIENEVDEIIRYNFVKFYREHPELADEDDGIKHFFPKEEKTDETKEE